MCVSVNINMNWMEFRLFFDTVSVFGLYIIKCDYIVVIDGEYMSI
jgi:hypothetical protein